MYIKDAVNSKFQTVKHRIATFPALDESYYTAKQLKEEIMQVPDDAVLLACDAITSEAVLRYSLVFEQEL